MTTSTDLILLPLFRKDGQDQPELTGLQAASAPRRAARGRSLDRLVIHLELVGTAPLSSAGYTKLLDHLTQLYFKTSGSSTAAMRTVAEWLNEYLLERNQRGQSRSMQASGVLTLAVFRGSHLYLAQCGPSHTYFVNSSGLQHFHEPITIGRGLGMGRVANIRYRQFEVSPQDFLLICIDPPSSWDAETLAGLHGMSMGNLHRRLLQVSGPDFSTAMIYLQSGTGNLRVLRSEPVKSEKREIQEDAKMLRVELPQEAPAQQIPESEIPVGEVPPMNFASPEGEISQISPPDLKINQPAVSKAPTTTKAVAPAERPIREPVIGPALVKIGKASGDTWKQVSKSVGAMIKQMLPDQSLFSIPASWMGIIAIVIPLIVVTMAVTVYVQRGQRQLYEENYLKARYAADQALQLSDPNDLRASWGAVIDFLDQAEAHLVTEDTQVMRSYAQTVLDGLNEVTRLVFQPAIVDNLPASIQIKHLVVANDDTELYFLDGVDGRVYRATLTDRGFVVDKNFICEPIPQSESLIVGKLVDITLLPLGNPDNAVVMGMDGNGNLLQCIPGGKAPLAISMPPPDMNWGTPLAFAMDSYDLYVLDPVTNAVWIFWGRDNYAERPELFFDDDIPPMGDVIDLTVYREDLFLLHETSQLTLCSYGAPTRCIDPAEIHNLPEGLDSTGFMSQAHFSEIQFISTPNPSLYLLDPDTKSIYQFSRTLAYHQQYRAQNHLPDAPVSAFVISLNHQAFMAIGNQVYFAPLP